MTEPHTAAEDAAYLLGLANRLEPAAGKRAAQLIQADAETLRRIATHLQRIATGGDRRLPEGMPE